MGACGGTLTTLATAGAADVFRQELAGLGGASAAGFTLVLSVWYESDFPGFFVDFAFGLHAPIGELLFLKLLLLVLLLSYLYF